MSEEESQATIAALWEHPSLCIAFFGVQFHSDEGLRLYEQAGIGVEMDAAMETAHLHGLLLNRPMMTPEGPLLMQYWRSFEELDRWARDMPHARWWRWLVENTGKGVAFYHELYQAKTAEAIYEPGTKPVGPALFCSTQEVKAGKGRSPERQQRFAEAASGQARH
jgi:Domain of unknown function (DUF4188)